MKHCLSVRSDLDTEEGRLLFANDIVERLFTRVWKDDKIMRRKRYFQDQPESKTGGKLAQDALNHKAQNVKWHPGSVVAQSWEQFKKEFEAFGLHAAPRYNVLRACRASPGSVQWP